MKKLAYEKTMANFKDAESRKKKFDDRLKDIEDKYKNIVANIERQETDKDKLVAAGITGDKVTA